jgi:hypothetical protein
MDVQDLLRGQNKGWGVQRMFSFFNRTNRALNGGRCSKGLLLYLYVRINCKLIILFKIVIMLFCGGRYTVQQRELPWREYMQD